MIATAVQTCRGPSAAALALLIITASPACADAIDGDWCSEEGRRISIQGPSVTTPAGVRMQGQYSRHSFAFTMPAAEADAGAQVDMALQGETRVSVRIGAAEARIWRRCPPGIS